MLHDSKGVCVPDRLKLAMASDHAGFALKEALKTHLAGRSDSIDLIDLGASDDQSVDYPDYGAAIGRTITGGQAERGIIICGSGIGISIAANRFPSVRAALCLTPEMARLARRHNDANVLALGARLIDEAMAKDCVDAFLETEFEGGRHRGRVDKLNMKGC